MSQWQFTREEIALLRHVLEAHVAVRSTAGDTETSPHLGQALAVYQPGISCRQLAGALGISLEAARRLCWQVEARMESREHSEPQDSIDPDGLLDKLNEMCGMNSAFVLHPTSVCDTGW